MNCRERSGRRLNGRSITDIVVDYGVRDRGYRSKEIWRSFDKQQQPWIDWTRKSLGCSVRCTYVCECDWLRVTCLIERTDQKISVATQLIRFTILSRPGSDNVQWTDTKPISSELYAQLTRISATTTFRLFSCCFLTILSRGRDRGPLRHRAVIPHSLTAVHSEHRMVWVVSIYCAFVVQQIHNKLNNWSLSFCMQHRVYVEFLASSLSRQSFANAPRTIRSYCHISIVSKSVSKYICNAPQNKK